MKKLFFVVLVTGSLSACSKSLFVEWVPVRDGLKPVSEVTEDCRAMARQTEVRLNPKCQSPADKSQSIARSCDSEDRFDRAARAGQAANAKSQSFEYCMNENGYQAVSKGVFGVI